MWGDVARAGNNYAAENVGFRAALAFLCLFVGCRGSGRSVVYAVEEAVNEGGFAGADVDVGFVVVFVEEDDRGVHYDSYLVLEFHDCVDI